jgi:hypothetical protein
MLSIVLAACDARPDALADLPLTSRVLAALSGARPHVMRLSDGERGAPCAPNDTSTLLPPHARKR